LRGRTESHWFWVYVGLLLLAAALRIASFTYGLPYVDHVDEPNFYLLANDQRGVLDAAWRENWLEGYPPGYIWMAAALMQGVDAIADLNIHTDMGNYIAILRLVSLLGDLLTLAALMTLARWLGGAAAGAIAGSGYVIAAEVLENAITALPDPLTVTFVVLCALLTVRALRRDQAAMALLATIFGLLAVVFKYPVFPVLLLPAAFFLRDLWQRRVRALPMAALALLLVGGTALYLLFAYGALNISNSEGLRARTSFFSSARWSVSPKTVKSRIRASSRPRSNTPSISTDISGAPLGATSAPSVVRQGMKRSGSAVSEPTRAWMPSVVTSTALVRNSDGTCAL